MFVSEFQAHRRARAAASRLRAHLSLSLSVRQPLEERKLAHLAAERLEDLVDQLGRIEATTADAPHIREGVVVVQLELGPSQVERLASMEAAFVKLERWAKGESLVTLGIAKRLVAHLRELVAEATALEVPDA